MRILLIIIIQLTLLTTVVYATIGNNIIAYWFVCAWGVYFFVFASASAALLAMSLIPELPEEDGTADEYSKYSEKSMAEFFNVEPAILRMIELVGSLIAMSLFLVFSMELLLTIWIAREVFQLLVIQYMRKVMNRGETTSNT